MQTWCLLDVASQVSLNVLVNYEYTLRHAVEFPLDGQLIVAACCTPEFDGIYAIVFDRTGQEVSRFKSAAGCVVRMAVLAEDRVACASFTGFQIWHLHTGTQLLSIAVSDSADWRYPGGEDDDALITADISGRRLAYSPAGSSVVCFLDALTPKFLCGVNCHMAPASEPDFGYRRRIVFGVHSFLLYTGGDPGEEGSLHVLKPTKEMGELQGLLSFEGQQAEVSAPSPDGAFISTCHRLGSRCIINVYDTRSGRLMLLQAVETLASTGDCRFRWQAHGMWWSACGLHLLIHLRNMCVWGGNDGECIVLLQL